MSSVGTVSARPCDSTPCGIEDACEAGTIFAKFEYNEDEKSFELEESTPFFDLSGVFEFTIEEANDDGEPLKVCWTQSDSADGEAFDYLLGSARVKAGPECSDFVDVDQNDCISVPGPQAISNIQFCSPVLFQADFHTGDSRATPKFTKNEGLINYVISRTEGGLRRSDTVSEPLNGDLSDDEISINGFSTDGGGTASVDYDIPADAVPNTEITGVTEDSVVVTLDVFARPRRRLGPLAAQVRVGSATNTHELGTEVEDSLSVGLPDPLSCD